MPKKFTAKSVEHEKAGDARREIPDAGAKGLYLIVQPKPSGAKSFAVRYTNPITRKSDKFTLGLLALADARVRAAQITAKVAQGIDPKAEVAKAKADAELADKSTLRAVCEAYMKKEGRKLRSADAREAILRGKVFPLLGHRPIAEIRRGEIVAMLDSVHDKNGPMASGMVLAILRKICHWHEARTDDFRSPIVQGMAMAKAPERERVLSDDELRKVWTASLDEKRLDPSYGAAIRYLILTGARRDEACKMKRSEVGTMHDGTRAFTVWRLPARRSKSKREVVRPLSGAALALLNEQPTIGDSEYVFTATGIKPVSFNNAQRKARLDEISGVKGWRLHDLRRTFRSLLPRLHIPFDIRERLIGHTLPKLTRTYDPQVEPHLAAMQEATNRAAAELERIVSGQTGGKVIAFPGAVS
jgi:integrase